MVTLQSWVDATRSAVDPLHLMAGGLVAVLLVLYLLNRPAGARDRAPPGGHYMGKITPKSLPGMLVTPEKKSRRKSRAEMAEAIRKAAEQRRELEALAEELGVDVGDLDPEDLPPRIRRR